MSINKLSTSTSAPAITFSENFADKGISRDYVTACLNRECELLQGEEVMDAVSFYDQESQSEWIEVRVGTDWQCGTYHFPAPWDQTNHSNWDILTQSECVQLGQLDAGK